ncbi:hypothetical protein BGW42_008747 [Actinomortierella wolfii]|nr:hypothetical protein BGW42_008747 [Actinomortierella wolfii]
MNYLNPQTWMGSMAQQRWSLNNFPIGIGLAAAAHLHMRNKFRAIADQQERGHLIRRNVLSLNQVLGAIDDLRDLDNAIQMLDKAIAELEGKRPQGKNGDHLNRNPSRRQRMLDQRRKARENTQFVHADDTSNVVMTEIGNGIRIEFSRVPRLLGDDTPWETDSDEEQSSLEDDSDKPYQPSQSTMKRPMPDLAKWSSTCQELRKSRDASIEKTIRQVATFESLLVGLDKSYFSAICWTATAIIRYAITTDPISNAVGRIIAGAHWVATRLKFWSSNSNVRSTSSAATAIALKLQHSTSFLFLPLVPTILISGMHFMVAARARWIISKIQRTYRESMIIAKRHSIAATLLSIRQERLEWLQKEIEAFERAEERGAQTDRRDGSQSGSSATDDSNSTGSRNNTNNNYINNNNNRHHPTPDRRVQLAIEQFNNAVRAGLRTTLGSSPNNDHSRQRTSSSGARSDTNLPTATATSSTSSNSTPDLADRTGRHYVLKNPGIQMLGPDLFTMDLEAFLRDPQERRRILRLEAKAMRTDLRLMRKQVIDQSKKAATQAIQ